MLWHSPECSKSRAALALLEERASFRKGGAFSVRDYLKKPPTRVELQALRSALGLPVAHWTRAADDGQPHEHTDDDSLIEAILARPALLERPIFVVRNGRPTSPFCEAAVIGRPPARVAELWEAYDAADKAERLRARARSVEVKGARSGRYW